MLYEVDKVKNEIAMTMVDALRAELKESEEGLNAFR